MTVTTHIYYKTSDGKEFLEKELAELHEAYTVQKAAVEREYQDKISAINWKRLQKEWPKLTENLSKQEPLLASEQPTGAEYNFRSMGEDDHIDRYAGRGC